MTVQSVKEASSNLLKMINPVRDSADGGSDLRGTTWYQPVQNVEGALRRAPSLSSAYAQWPCSQVQLSLHEYDGEQ